MLDRFDSNEFNTIELLATSGGLGCPDSDARISYYGISGYPTLMWNGGSPMVGAGTDVIDGSVYDPVVRNLMAEATPVALKITDHSFLSGNAFVTVEIALEEDLPAGGSYKLRVALVEDRLVYGSVVYDNVLRDMLPDVDLTIDTAGQVQTETIAFSWNSGWSADDFRAIAFVQNDADQAIMQTCNSLPRPDYSMRHYGSGARIVVADSPYSFDQAGLFNAGQNTDTYTVTLDTSGIPADGSAYFLYGGEQLTSATITLDPDQRALFNVVIDSGSEFEATAVLNFHSESGMIEDRSLSYKLIAAGADILLVDDDGAFEYESLYFLPALAGTGKSVATWDRGSTALSAEILSSFDIVIWECGWAFPTVDAADRAAIAAYLDGGGNLFITGQDIGWEMYDNGGASVAWYNNYLHATYVNDDTNNMTLDGVAGTFTEGLSLTISGGDGANNQEYPSDIDPRGAFASSILTYSSTQNGGIMADTGVYKVVYLAFGFEAINNAADRAALMEGIIDFLSDPLSAAPDGEAPRTLTLLGNTPNPFNPQTKIQFRLPEAMRVQVQVFDLAGRLVRVLDQGTLPAGLNEMTWDGRDSRGRDSSSGTYFYQVSGPGETLTGKMMLVR